MTDNVGPDMIRLWSRQDHPDDHRTWQQRRNDALAEQQERYRRGAAYRAGKLDEYDAIHWPERLAEASFAGKRFA